MNDGILDIEFVHRTENPRIKAIEFEEIKLSLIAPSASIFTAEGGRLP